MPATHWWPKNFKTGVSFFAATLPIFSRRLAGSATTLRSKMQSISVGNLPRCSKAGVARPLLETYEMERQALARRNTNYARRFADSVGLYVPPVELEDDTAEGQAARKIASDHFNYHARFEFNIPGITFGGRYDGSPIVVADGGTPPPDKPNEYVPTGCPGGRAPHLWLDDEYSLYDGPAIREIKVGKVRDGSGQIGVLPY
jgi:hypothetical protein